jgi:hypothetical protein
LYTFYIKGICPLASCGNSSSTPTLRKSLAGEQE